MARSGAQRTRAATAEDARTRRRSAIAYLEVAELVLRWATQIVARATEEVER